MAMTDEYTTSVLIAGAQEARSGRAMTGKMVEEKARAIADHTFSNATMRAMLFESIMQAFAPEYLRWVQEREEHERRRYGGCEP